MKIKIINGPNLNLLGTREQDVYGQQSFLEYFKYLQQEFQEYNLEYFQSNEEGALINEIHAAGQNTDLVILNAGGYTHTSVALRDAIAAIETPVIEVHISNVLAREEFRHTSLIGGVCEGSIAGFGLKSYYLALQTLD